MRTPCRPPFLYRVIHATHHLCFSSPVLGQPVPGYLLSASGRQSRVSKNSHHSHLRFLLMLTEFTGSHPAPLAHTPNPFDHRGACPHLCSPSSGSRSTPCMLLFVPLHHLSHVQLGPGTHRRGDRFYTQQSLSLTCSPHPILPLFFRVTRAPLEGSQCLGIGSVFSEYKPELLLSCDLFPTLLRISKGNFLGH